MKTTRRLLAANWKMHLTLSGAQGLTSELLSIFASEKPTQAPVVLGVPFPMLHACQHLTKEHSQFALAGQNLHEAQQGAYTGEVSADMLVSVGASYVIVGHSERRQYFHESNELLHRKVARALSAGLKPIYCFGETLAERNEGQTETVIEAQLREGLFALPQPSFAQVVLAYEPVWAIGTGLSATPAQAEEIHSYIRKLLAGQYGNELADAATILYGGSVKAANAAELFVMPNIDGGLVGGASLDSREFARIAQAMNE